MQSSEDLGNTFSHSWELLSKNWIIIVPGVVIGILAAIAIVILGMFGFATGATLASAGMAGAGVASAFLSAMIIGVVAMLASILVIAYTTGMAGAAWRTGVATLADGAAAFNTEGAQTMIAVVLLFVLGVIAVALSIVTFGLALLAFYLFFLYALPSVIVGNRSASEGLGESARITAKNFVATLAIVVLLAIAFIVASSIAGLFHGIPLIGALIGQVITQSVAAYATLVVVGEYLKLRSTIEPVSVAAPPGGPPPPPPSA